MNKHILVFIAFIFALMHMHSQSATAKNQVKEPAQKKVGDKVKEAIACATPQAPKAWLAVPTPSAYTLLYHYHEFNGATDNNDSIALLSSIITKLAPMSHGLGIRLSCLALTSHPSDNKKLLAELSQKTQMIQKPENIQYFAMYPTAVNEQKTASVLNAGKLVWIAPDGTILAASDHLGNFSTDANSFNYGSKKTTAHGSTLKGKLLTENNGVKTPVSDAPVFLFDANRDTVSKAITNKFGDFELSNGSSNSVIHVAPKDNTLKTLILATQEGKEISRFHKTSTGFEYKLIQADIIKLSDMPVNDDISVSFKQFAGSGRKELKQIENIDYGLSKYDIDEGAKSVLNKIVSLMNENPGVKLEIISHTDAQGDDVSNRELSVKRSNAVADYLISKGISRTRLTAIGKGETEIRNRCTNNVDCSETEHRYNRRTEFRFIKT